MLSIFGRAGATPLAVAEKPHAPSCFMTVVQIIHKQTLHVQYTGGQHARCIAIYMGVRLTVKRIPWWLFYVEMSIRRVIEQGLTPSKRKDGRLWKENRHLLS